MAAFPLPEFRPLPDPAAVVRAPNVRFTVLTTQLVRLEYSPTDRFEDRPSQAFWFREQPVPEFTVRRSSRQLKLTTDHLDLTYDLGKGGFHSNTLAIRVKDTRSTWKYGDKGLAGNLLGTARTLDKSGGQVRLEPGLISRAGWAVVDDSNSLVFNSRGWLEPRLDSDQAIDLYFFGYGHEYKQCLHDYCRISGPVPLLPRWALGNWWSRYWAYTQEELEHLVEEFRKFDLPLSVCVIDMDWHIVETGNSSSGWTGYTWNRSLFPEPGKLLRWLHRQGLRVSLNLHPAEGVHPHEAEYGRMARVTGLDPESSLPVVFDITDRKFISAYFSILHHPHERQGVDFWWIDWQQGATSKIQGFDPLWWLNHLHFLDLGRGGKKRPLILSRWGGLGNHRYPIGFSGDTLVGWDTLAFQPYFTATAANVGYAWWSHDIGGHMDGLEDPELFTRWVQFGVFSPIFRLHSTKNPYHERRPWKYDREIFSILREAMQLRYSLIPYLYTMAKEVSTSGEALVRPMYYEHPQDEAAYLCPNQYYFGSELIAAPFVAPIEEATRLSSQSVWLPEAGWCNFFTGDPLSEGWHTVYGKLTDIPVFARPGAIVPLGSRSGWNGWRNPKELTIHVFPGADNRLVLYEDDGFTTAHEHGKVCQTTMSLRWEPDRLSFDLGPADGDRELIPRRRTFRLVFHSIRYPRRIEVLVDGSSREVSSEYDELSGTLVLQGVPLSPEERLSIMLLSDRQPLTLRRDRRVERCRDLLGLFRMPTDLKYKIDRDLPKIVKNKKLLFQYRPAIHDAQIAVLRDVIDSRD